MEINILMTIQKLHMPFLDFLFSHITALGDNGIFWISIGVLLLCTRKYRRYGILLLLSLLAAFLLGNIMLKNLVERSRPCWIYPEVGLLIRIPRDYSFPSGHSMVGFAGATAVWKMNKGWGVAALILAGSIAFSRLYLFVHWPSDVLIGSIIGILLAILIFEIENRVRTGKEKLERYENV